MKILFIGTFPPPFGGIASHLNDLLPSLAENEFQVISLTKSNSNEVKESGNMKNLYVNIKSYFAKNLLSCFFSIINYVTLKSDLTWKKLFKTIIISNLVKSICKKEKIDMIFIYDNDQGLIIPILRKMGIIKPINLMIFGDFYLYPEKYKKIKKYYYKVLNNTDLLMASSDYCGKSAQEVMGYDFDYKVVYIGVDEEKYFPSKSEKSKSFLDIPNNSFVYFFLGRMDKSMGIDFLLENAQKILNLGDDVYLVLAGAKGDFSQKVKNLSNKFERILYYENIPFEKKLNFYHACDVYLAPTIQKHACMGVSIKEAMACGKPAIASNSGGIPEAITNGENGFVIPAKNNILDNIKFIDAAKQLYESSDLRKSMGEKGRQTFLKKFTNQITTKNYLGIINNFSNYK